MLAPNPVAGVDVGKSFLDLDFDPAAKALRVRNDAPGIAALIEAMRPSAVRKARTWRGSARPTSKPFATSAAVKGQA